MLGSRRVLLPEAVRERLVAAHRFAVLEGHERDPVARLGERRAVPRAVYRGARPAAIALRKLGPRVERQAVGRPVSRERHGRLLLLGAPPDLLAVAAVFRRQHEMAELQVMIAVRPAEVVALVDLEQLLRRLLGILRVVEEFRPILSQLVAAVLRAPPLAVRREGHAPGVANAGGLRRPNPIRL